MTDQHHQTAIETFVKTERRDEIIRGATRRNLPATLTRFGPGGWATYHTRFLSCNADERNIWIVQPTEERRGQPLTLRPGEHIGVSFRHRRAKCSFSSVVIGAVVAHKCDGENADKAVIQWPDSLQEMQRRLYRRVSPPSKQPIEVSFWESEIPSSQGHARTARRDAVCTRPPDQMVRTGRLMDLSAGGLRVATAEESDDLAEGQRVVCEFTPRPGDQPLRLDARLQHIEPAAGGFRSLGFQFVGLDASMEGQCRLAHLASIVTAFRRSRVRAPRPPLSVHARS